MVMLVSRECSKDCKNHVQLIRSIDGFVDHLREGTFILTMGIVTMFITVQESRKRVLYYQ